MRGSVLLPFILFNGVAIKLNEEAPLAKGRGRRKPGRSDDVDVDHGVEDVVWSKRHAVDVRHLAHPG